MSTYPNDPDAGHDKLMNPDVIEGECEEAADDDLPPEGFGGQPLIYSDEEGKS